MSTELERRRLNASRLRRERRSGQKPHCILLKGAASTSKGGPVAIATTGGLAGEVVDGYDVIERHYEDRPETRGIELIVQASANVPADEAETVDHFALVDVGADSGPRYECRLVGRPEDLIGERAWRYESTGRVAGSYEIPA
jgi:hypothetical protein